MVSHLAAHFSIERSLVKNQNSLFAAGDGTGNFLAHANSQNSCVAGVRIIANKGSGRDLRAQVNTGPA